MPLIFNYKQKPQENLQSEICNFITKKINENSIDKLEIIVPRRVLQFVQDLLNSKNKTHDIIKKDIYYNNFTENGPEDVYPPLQYVYSRPCIMLNNKTFKLHQFRYDVDDFNNNYVVIKIT